MTKIELRPEQIEDIIEKYKSNYKVEDLCNIYNVGRKIIYKYTKGITISSFDSVTKCVTLKTISHHEYIRDFIRGLFDGDGCISPYYSDNALHCSWSIVSSLEVCNYIKDLFKELFDINMTVLPDTGIYRIETSTDSSILNIMQWLYENENCRCLQRKKIFIFNGKHYDSSHKI